MRAAEPRAYPYGAQRSTSLTRTCARADDDVAKAIANGARHRRPIWGGWQRRKTRWWWRWRGGWQGWWQRHCGWLRWLGGWHRDKRRSVLGRPWGRTWRRVDRWVRCARWLRDACGTKGRHVRLACCVWLIRTVDPRQAVLAVERRRRLQLAARRNHAHQEEAGPPCAAQPRHRTVGGSDEASRCAHKAGAGWRIADLVKRERGKLTLAWRGVRSSEAGAGGGAARRAHSALLRTPLARGAEHDRRRGLRRKKCVAWVYGSHRSQHRRAAHCCNARGAAGCPRSRRRGRRCLRET